MFKAEGVTVTSNLKTIKTSYKQRKYLKDQLQAEWCLVFKSEGFRVTSILKTLKTSYKQSGVLWLRLKALQLQTT